MADEEKEVEKEAGFQGPKSSKNPLLTVLLLGNALLMGAVAYFQYMGHKKISEQPDIRDVVKAQMKEIEAKEGKKEGEGGGGHGSGGAKEGAPAMVSHPEDGITFPLDTFTANLAQGEGPRRYVRMQAVLRFSKDSSEEEFKARKPQIRDSVINILNSKRPEDLLKSEGKQYLKEEIKAAVNSFLIDGKVIDVFYVDLQVN